MNSGIRHNTYILLFADEQVIGLLEGAEEKL